MIPCGLDIQEVRKVRSQRIVGTGSYTKRAETGSGSKESGKKEFCSTFGPEKKSFLKLSGDGITKSMRDLETPGWYEEFQVDRQILGCICSGEECYVRIQQVSAEKFFQRFLP